jgi:hypothetical protein
VAERLYLFALAALGVWRITHMVSSEDGPWHLFVRVRQAVESRTSATLLSCFYCLSVWVAIPFAVAIGAGIRERLLLWLALSAAAILLERVTARSTPAAEYFEHPVGYEGDRDHVMLRKEQ